MSKRGDMFISYYEKAVYSKCRIIFCISFVLLFILINAVSGKAYFYVRSGATGSNNGADWTNAWSSTSNINWASINPGDTIFIAAGTYGALNVGKSGTAGNPITFKRATNAEHGIATGWSSSYDGRVIIDGGGVNPNGNGAIHLGGAGNYITIDGATKYGIWIRNAYYGIWDGPPNFESESLTVRYVEIGDPGSYKIAEDGIQGRGNNLLVEYSYIHDNDNGDTHGDGIQWFNGNNINIRYNIFKNNGQMFMLTDTAWGNDYINDIDIYYNIFYNRGGSHYNGISKKLCPQAGHYWHVYNNVFDLEAPTATGSWQDEVFSGTGSCSQMVFTNNAVINSRVYSLEDMSHSYNAYDNSGTFSNLNGVNGATPSTETGWVRAADLGFVSVTTGTSNPANYHLTASSPLIGKGTNVGLTRDFDGNPVSGTPSIGAFEYRGGTSVKNYYVRTNGNDNCDGLADVGGSSGNCAFSTIQKGISVAQAGDTITVHAGTYSADISSVRSGSSGNPITITAASGETVTIGKATITHDYIVVQGFLITSYGAWGSAGIQVNGNFNKILSNTIMGDCYGDGRSGNCIGLQLDGSNNIASYNTLDGKGNQESSSFTVAIYLSGNDNQVTFNTVKDANGVERVFELYGLRNRIANNEVRNGAWTIGNGAHPDIFQTFGTGASRDHIIENNYFHDMDYQLGNLEANGLNGDSSNVRDWTFRNNVIANVKLEFFNHVPRINWYNNIFYRCNTGNTGLGIYNNYEAGSGIINNNAFIACGTSSSNGWYAGTVTADYNFVSNTATGGAKSGFSETHGVNGGNPALAAVSNDCTSNACDFHVGANSALIDRGTVISGFTTDKDGQTRPKGASWDIGAYEFSGAQPSFDFSLTNGGSKSLIQGQSATNTITSTLISGTTQPVSFSATGLPSGATASYSPTSCSPTCATTITINTLSTTPTGNYTININGNGAGLTRTTNFRLIVNPIITISCSWDFFPEGNADGKVTLGDVLVVVNNFGKTSASPGFNSKMDFNNNNQIDLFDVLTILAHFGGCGG